MLPPVGDGPGTVRLKGKNVPWYSLAWKWINEKLDPPECLDQNAALRKFEEWKAAGGVRLQPNGGWDVDAFWRWFEEQGYKRCAHIDWEAFRPPQFSHVPLTPRW